MTLKISVVVPCYNEQDVLEQTNDRLMLVLKPIEDLTFEVIYVDDGSVDNTFPILANLQASHSEVGVVRLSRNFGHQVAITAGLEHAVGDAVIVIDADLQDPPEVIPEMLKKWREGYDVVYGVRDERKGESAHRLRASKAFYRILNRLSEVKIPVDAGDFRLLDRRIVNTLMRMPEQHRYMRGMSSWVGQRQTEIRYARAGRAAGVSKYPVRKSVALALDGVFSFSVVPLKLVTWLGLLASAISLLGIFWAVFRKVTQHAVPGWAATFVAVLFIGGAQLISVGVIGEYIGRIYGEVKGRPLYVVDTCLGLKERASVGPPH